MVTWEGLRGRSARFPVNQELKIGTRHREGSHWKSYLIAGPPGRVVVKKDGKGADG